MKKSPLFLISLCSLCLLNACGGGGSSSGGGGGNTAATHFSLTAPAAVSAGATFSVTVTALDSANNVATGYSGIVNFTSTDGQFGLSGGQALIGATGTFPLTLRSAGSQTITATDVAKPTITGTTSSIAVTIEVARLTVAVPTGRGAAAYNYTFTAGAPLNFTVTALDGLGNVFPGYTGKVSFASTDGQAVLPTSSNLTNGTGPFRQRSRPPATRLLPRLILRPAPSLALPFRFTSWPRPLVSLQSVEWRFLARTTP